MKAISVVALALCALAVAGCGNDGPSDPFARASLHRALYGPLVPSPGFRYQLVAPEVVEAAGDYVLVREGNVSTFITGDGLAGRIAGHDTATLVFNVVKGFTPAPHFRALVVIAGGDSIPVPQGRSIQLPRMTDIASFTPDDYASIDMTRFRCSDTAGLNRDLNRKYQLSARLVRVEEGQNRVWMLEGAEPSTRGQVPILRIAEPPPALGIVLDLMARSGGVFQGGVTVTGVEPWSKRRDNHVCATVELDYLVFLDRVFRA